VKHEPATDKPKILIVEDHPDVLQTIVFLLHQRAGCNVVAAQTGVQGLELARDGDFDLITLDIDLPGINGFEICRQLKQDPVLRQTPVIFVSGRSCADDIHRGLALGAADYITKPFDALSFVSRVLSHVKAKPKNQDSSACLSL
jgi:sigma-B regulation protein RsbU (phosphoserine phosphatase)